MFRGLGRLFLNYYLMSSIVNAGISFVVIIYLSHVLDARGYVAVGVFSGIMMVMPSIVGFQTRSYFLRCSVKTDYLSYSDGLLIKVCFFWMVISVFLLFASSLILSVNEVVDLDLVLYFCLCSIFQWFYYTALVLAQSKRKSKLYFLVVASSSALAALYVFLKGELSSISWVDRVFGLSLGFLGGFVVCLFVYRSEIERLWGRDLSFWVEVKKSIKYSIYLLPFGLSLSLVLFMDRYVVSEYFSEEVAAMYMSLCQFVLVYSILCDSLYKKVTPVFMADGNIAKLVDVGALSIIALLLFLAVGEWVYYLVFPDYFDFRYDLYLAMLIVAVTGCFVKLLSLLFNFNDENASLAQYVVPFNLIGLVVMVASVVVLRCDVLAIPISIACANGIAVLLMFVRLKRKSYV